MQKRGQQINPVLGQRGVSINILGRVLINRDCSATARCRKRRVRYAGCSGDLPLPSPPPAEKTAARQDQARQSRDGARDLRMLDEHHFRSLGKLVVGNLDRIADVDNVGN